MPNIIVILPVLKQKYFNEFWDVAMFSWVNTTNVNATLYLLCLTRYVEKIWSLQISLYVHCIWFVQALIPDSDLCPGWQSNEVVRFHLACIISITQSLKWCMFEQHGFLCNCLFELLTYLRLVNISHVSKNSCVILVFLWRFMFSLCPLYTL